MRLAPLSLSLLVSILGCGGGHGSTSGGHDGGACTATQLKDSEGTCHDVGIQGCVDKFVDADGVCRPSITKCGKGEIPVFTEGCVAVGIPSCDPSFVDADGICRPLASKCGAGTFPVPQKGCVPIDGPSGCGTDTWGNIPDAADNVYVDQTYQGGASTGSKSAPFTTIANALAAVKPGGRIAIAAGHYSEPVSIASDVEIAGRCPSMVTIDGDGNQSYTVDFSAGTATLRGVTVSGDSIGVHAHGAAKVTLDGVRVQNTISAGVLAVGTVTVNVTNSLMSDIQSLGVPDTPDGFGLTAAEGAQITVADSAFVKTTSAALHGDGAGTKLTITDVVADGITETDFFLDGDGLSVSGGATADISASALSAGDYNGIQLTDDGSKVTATGVLLRGDPMAGGGLGTFNGVLLNDGGTLSLTQSVVERNLAGASVQGDMTLDRTLMLDAGPVIFLGKSEITDCAFVRDVLVAVDLASFGSMTVDVKRILVEDSQPDMNGKYGIAVSTEGPADVTFDSVFVSGGKVAGFILDEMTTGKITNTTVSGVQVGTFSTTVNGPEMQAGDGVVASASTLTVQGVRAENCGRAGMFYAGSEGSVAASISTKNQYGIVINGSSAPTLDMLSDFDGNSDKAVDNGALTAPKAPAPAPPQ